MATFELDGSRLLKVKIDAETFKALNGSMVAYDGDVSFKRQSIGAQGGMKGAFKRKLTGESLTLMDVSGKGVVYIANMAMEINTARHPATTTTPPTCRASSAPRRRSLGLGPFSGEEHQFDFTGAGTVLMQSSETMRESAAVVREMESQLGLLGTTSLQHLQTPIQQRLGQQQR